jgi:hypothetical protein
VSRTPIGRWVRNLESGLDLRSVLRAQRRWGTPRRAAPAAGLATVSLGRYGELPVACGSSGFNRRAGAAIELGGIKFAESRGAESGRGEAAKAAIRGRRCRARSGCLARALLWAV